MKDFFRDKLEYNHSCNRKLITLIESNPYSYSEKARILIGHTLNAQNIWNHRILNSDPTQEVWDTFEISELQKINNENHDLSLEVIEKLNLRSTIHYKNTEGKQFSNKVNDILYHIINHSTYHRGQLISELKSHGVTPITTDFIFYKR